MDGRASYYSKLNITVAQKKAKQNTKTRGMTGEGISTVSQYTNEYKKNR